MRKVLQRGAICWFATVMASRRSALLPLLFVVCGGLWGGGAGPAFGGTVQQQLAELTASDGVTFNSFGQQVAIAGSVVVVGAPGDADERGAVYVFVEPPGGWGDATETAKLTASDGQAGDGFGQAVAVSGDTIVVGAPNLGGGGAPFGRGAAYVFVEPPGGWAEATETAKLTASDGVLHDRFGVSVAVAAETVAIGAPSDDIGTRSNQGSAYVFVRPPTGWADGTETAKLTASDGVALDRFGVVALDPDALGDVLAVGAGSRSSSRGAIYVFERPAEGWAPVEELAVLTASDAAVGDQLGWSVALSGGTLVAGAALDDVGALNQGSVYLFERPALGWADGTESAKLNASDGAQWDQLGGSVAISSERVVSGAFNAEVAGQLFQGAVYLFERPAGGWIDATETQKLTAAQGEAEDRFGGGVGVEGAVVVAGASALSTPSHIGAAYVFGPGDGCTLPPSFDGVEEVVNPTGAGCGGLRPTWHRGSSNCGSAPPLYDVYRSPVLDFEPGPDTLVASCVDGTSYLDLTAPHGEPSYYVVRAEDDSGNGSGPCANGNVDPNLRRVRGFATTSPVVLFDDDLESGPGAWESTGVGDDPWLLVDTDSHSPTHSFFGADGPWCHKKLRFAVPVDILGNPTYLEFYHRFHTESARDACLLEYSIDGVAFHDILDGSLVGLQPPIPGRGPIPPNPGRFLIGRYDSKIDPDHPDPGLRGRPAWSGDSGPELGLVRVDLADFAGFEVTFQWRVRCDATVSFEGWYVDDVRLAFGTECAGLVFADGFESGDLAAWSSTVPTVP